MKINIEELLKDCPKGMEFDCTIYNGKVCFEGIDENNHAYPIMISIDKVNIERLDSWGQYSTRDYAKCIIFPKGKTTWEGFQRPFKDGDILTNKRGSICIYKGPMYYNKNLADFYCGYRISDHAFIFKKFKDKHFGDVNELRFATEEEKQKLFDVINANGCKWNAETKTFEKLVPPKFHEGDWITMAKPCQIIGMDYNGNYLVQYWDNIKVHVLSKNFCESHFHLWTIKDAKDGDVISYDDGWTCIFKCIHGIWYSSHCFVVDGEFYTGYEEHAVDSIINGNAHPATKEQRNFLFQKIKESGYKWNKDTKTLEGLIQPKFKIGDIVQNKITNIIGTINLIINSKQEYQVTLKKGGIVYILFECQDSWELVPNKFDISTLKPFESRVLMRSSNAREWVATFYSHYSNNKFYGCGMCCDQCIPYEGNEHLCGTTNDCNEFYKTW